jgi:serine/threonine-protein kinase HipA
MSKNRRLLRLSVWLGQTLVGNITELPNDRSLFAFDPDYINNQQRPVLSSSFYNAEGELNSEPILKTTKVAAFFSNLLPEGELRSYIAGREGIKAIRDLPLLRLLGEDLPGAVVVRPEEDGPPSLESDDDEAIVEQADEKKPLRFSLAGIQMKFSATGSPERGWTIPAEGKGGHWILKLPSEKHALVPENEHSMMEFARRVGIQAAETGLVSVREVEGLPKAFQEKNANALWVKRFDRTENGRIHMEDFNQLYSQFPDDKYENYSYRNMAGDLAVISGAEDVLEFVRRLIFSAAIGNADMHLKNWTLLYPDGRTPRISPAYDFVSTIAYIPDLTMALSFYKKHKEVEDFTEERLRRFASSLPIPEHSVVEAALEIAEKVVRTWKEVKNDLPAAESVKQLVTERINLFPLTRKFAI